METRADSLIPLDSQNVGKPLPLAEGWLNSSHVMLIFPDCVYAKVGVKIGNPSTAAYGTAVWGVLHPRMNYWHVYIPRTTFTAAGETRYKVVAEDLRGGRHVCGEGVFRVFRGDIVDPSDVDGGGDAVHEAFVECGGTWYAIDVVTDQSGTLSINLVNQASAPDAQERGTPYAYSRRTGLYHAISAYVDESGVVALALEENGVEGEFASFAYDPTTRLYYRLECQTDEGGVPAIEIGDSQQ